MDRMKIKLSENELCRLSELYRVFASTTRIRILYKIAEKDYCVGELAHALNMSKSIISQQLK